MTDDTLQRFFSALVEALRERSPADISGPFTVAEIYQDLVPYRTHRDRLAVEMNGDYEHALLRLLAGQGGYLHLESEHALAEIRDELDGLNPNTSVYRDFAAVDVRIVAEMVPDLTEPVEAPADEAPPARDGSSTRDDFSMGEADSLAPDAGPRPDTSEEEVAFVEGAAPGTSDPVRDEQQEATSAIGSGSGSCRWCGSELPDRDRLVFCPYCGEDQARTPCRSCGEALEAGWEFCVSCGARKSS